MTLAAAILVINILRVTLLCIYTTSDRNDLSALTYATFINRVQRILRDDNSRMRLLSVYLCSICHNDYQSIAKFPENCRAMSGKSVLPVKIVKRPANAMAQ